MKIDRFKAQMQTGPQMANRFNVAMFGTGAKNSGLSVKGMKCTSASIPGRGFFTVEDSEYGPKRAIPHKPQYDQFDCEFLLTNDFEERELIELWQGSMNSYQSNGNAGAFHSRFHDDYTGVILVEALNKADRVNFRCLMTDAYPIQIGVSSLSQESSDILKLSCQFRYRYYHTEFMNSKPDNLITGFMDKHINKFGDKLRGKIEDAIY